MGPGGAPLAVIPSDLLARCWLPVAGTICSAGLEVLVPEWGVYPAGDPTMIPLNWKSRLPRGCRGPRASESGVDSDSPGGGRMTATP